MDHKLFK